MNQSCAAVPHPHDGSERLYACEKGVHVLIEQIVDYAIVWLSPDGRVVGWNPGAARIEGYTEAEIRNCHISLFYPVEAMRKGQPEAALAVARRQGQWTGEGWRLRKGGHRFWAHEVITAIYGAEGTLCGFVKIVRDMTAQKRAEAAQRESEAMFRALAEQARAGVVLLQNGGYRYVNPSFARITGYTPEELVGQAPETLFHPSDRALVREHVRRCLAGEAEEAHYEAHLVTKPGDVRTVEVHGSRCTWRGQPAIIGTMLDITERRQLQRDVLRMQEEERRRLGQDLHDGVASHFFGVSMMLGALARSVTGDDELQRRVQEIQALVEEGTEDVRRFSRGLNPAGLTDTDLPTALERLVDNVEGGRLDIGEGVSTLDDATAAQLYWIAQEAVANARRYAEADRLTVRLRRGDPRHLVLEVEDDGRGFAHSNQGESSEKREEGLGLRTMRYRAELLGAELTIDTAPGAGTRVTCRLPMA